MAEWAEASRSDSADRLGHGGQVPAQHRRRGLRRLHPSVHCAPASGVHACRQQGRRHQIRSTRSPACRSTSSTSRSRTGSGWASTTSRHSTSRRSRRSTTTWTSPSRKLHRRFLKATSPTSGVSFDFNRRAKILADANRLHAVVKHFSTLDLHPGASLGEYGHGRRLRGRHVPSLQQEGQGRRQLLHPARDAIKLMVDVLIRERRRHSWPARSAARSIYDPTAGSGGMLLIAQDALRRMNEKIDVTLFGRGSSCRPAFALGKADLLIQGGRPRRDQAGQYPCRRPLRGADLRLRL